MSETDCRVDELEIEIWTKYFTGDIVKEDNIECCVCLNFHWGVKLPNCSHFICPKCYYKMYHGYVSKAFYDNNPRPISPEKPIYPHTNAHQNTEIYNILSDDDTYKDWFINENEDLYNCIKINSEFVDNINNNVKEWFEKNELITNYETELVEYELNCKKHSDKMDIYLYLLEKERIHNIRNKCPLCRL